MKNVAEKTGSEFRIQGYFDKEMHIMFSSKHLKMTACTLAAIMGMGLAGPALTAAEASSHHSSNPRYERHEPVPEPHEDRHEPPRKHHEDNHETQKTHSQGDVNTAAILGAIAGAIIAKNT